MKATALLNMLRRCSQNIQLLTVCSLVASIAPCAGQTEPLDPSTLINLGKASVSHTTLDIGPIGNVFDGNTNSIARTPGINPMVVTLTFTTPKTLTGTRVWFLGGDNRWKVETADTVGDLDAGSGSFRIALDKGPDSSDAWHEGTFAAPITCMCVRLKLQRVVGDGYVHLSDWQLFLQSQPFRIVDSQLTAPQPQVTWNSSLNQWYEIQTSPDLTNWTSAGFRKGEENSTTSPVPPAPGDRRFFRVRKTAPEDRLSIVKRVLVLNLDPILEAHGNKRLSQYLGWNDPHLLTASYLTDLTTASGNYVQWQLAETVDLDLWPAATDGFRYTDTTYLQSWFNSQQYPWHQPNGADYDLILDLPLPSLGNKTAHQMAASGEVDEIIIWGAPYMSVLYESRMVGSTAYFCNAPELIRNSRLYVVMGLNYERGAAEALHSFGHRTESIMSRVYGSWSGTSTVNHLWDRFTRIGPRHPGASPACGNIHFPPNANSDYDYSASLLVQSEADDWLSFPNLTGATKQLNSTAWGGPDYQRNFLRWWYARLPKAPGRYVDASNAINDRKLNNWWGYIVDMNEYPESR